MNISTKKVYIGPMKRIVLTVLFVLSALAASAQPRALGVRAGLDYQISYQHSVGRHADFIEVDFGYQLLGNGLNAAVAYDFMVARPEWTRKGSWGVYAGPAIKAAFFGVGTCVSAGVEVGLEYTFEFPLQISLDIKPGVGVAIVNRTVSLYGGESTIGAFPSISLRYLFGGE